MSHTECFLISIISILQEIRQIQIADKKLLNNDCLNNDDVKTQYYVENRFTIL